MTGQTAAGSSRSLPVRGNLLAASMLSLALALLAALAALAGLVATDALYPTPALRQEFMPNDLVNLIIGLPALLGSLWLWRRGRLVGLLFWPGALIFLLYNHLIYALALPSGGTRLFYLGLVVLGLAALASLLAALDAPAIRERLSGAVPVRLSGGALAGMGGLVMLRALGVLGLALSGSQPAAGGEIALAWGDLIFGLAWVAGGVLLWRRTAWGYATGLGLLFQASLLFAGLILLLLVRPLLTAAPFALVDVLVVAVMGLVCFIPFGLFTRGVIWR